MQNFKNNKNSFVTFSLASSNNNDLTSEIFVMLELINLKQKIIKLNKLAHNFQSQTLDDTLLLVSCN